MKTITIERNVTVKGEAVIELHLDDVELFDTATLRQVLEARGLFVADEEPEEPSLDQYEDDDLIRELARRKVGDDFDDAAAVFARRDWTGVFWELEKVLPPAFAGFAERVATALAAGARP